MPSNQIFAQTYPAAGTDTVLFTGTGNIIANMWMGNQSGDDQVRVAIVPNGQSLSVENYIAYDTNIASHYSFYLQTLCFTTGDNVVVRSNNGTSSFTITGQLLD